MLIGYLDPNIFLGGTLKLDVAPAVEALRRDIAEPMGVDVYEAAIGIYRVAVAQTADVIRTITVERGVDPREFVLHAFGGTCPLICAAFGEELGVRRVVVPYTAAVNCALGLVSADVVHEYSLTATLPVAADPEEINAIFEPMEVRARAQLRDEGFADDRVSVERSIDLHYFRQVHEVTTPVRGRGPMDRAGLDTLVKDFEALYEKKFGKGSTYRGAGMEMTAFRLSVRGLMTKPKMEKEALQETIPNDAKLGQRDILVLSRQDFAPARIYDFDKLMPGNVIAGPAVIHTPITTIVVQDDQHGRLDAYRNFIIEFE
jgi:N-methylhydantoinase A